MDRNNYFKYKLTKLMVICRRPANTRFFFAISKPAFHIHSSLTFAQENHTNTVTS